MWRFSLFAFAATASAQMPPNTYHCNASAVGWNNLDLCLPDAADVTVTTTNGDIVGKSSPEGVSRFYGVEFADSTNSRFKYAQDLPLSPWTSPKQAKTITTCDTSEDCLQLHIATPASIVNKAATTAGLPVFVYFTGGGFVSYGNPPGPIMDMAYHARYGVDATDENSPGKAVFVYVNYRISILGFMAHPGMTTPSGSTGGGNIGLADGIAGLQWINANIASFGGDPNQVTIQGSSAGGGYVSLILASPLSVGLIKNVFSMSPYISYHPAFYSQTMRKQIAQAFVYKQGCTTTFDVPADGADADAQIQCMKDLDSSLLLSDDARNLAGTDAANGWEAFYGQTGLFSFIAYNFAVAPVIDGYVLDMPPLQAYASGRNSGVTVVMGHMANEYSGLFSGPGDLAPTGSAAFVNIPYQIGKIGRAHV